MEEVEKQNKQAHGNVANQPQPVAQAGPIINQQAAEGERKQKAESAAAPETVNGDQSQHPHHHGHHGHHAEKLMNFDGDPEHVHLRGHTMFPWKQVGLWTSLKHEDKRAQITEIKQVQSWVEDHIYADWWWNCSLMVGTCFFSWLLASWGFGILLLLVVGLFTTSVYKAEFRRFNRDIRDDMDRNRRFQKLQSQVETMEWLNQFLNKFWVIYMPAFSEMVMFQTNQILDGQAPGFGIDKLTLDEFTLGSKAPRINSVKTYPLAAHDHVEMMWDFAFAPSDTLDMTRKEIDKRIPPKVCLGVTIGKLLVLKTVPILVEEMLMTGRLKVTLKLMDNFPHVKMVSIQFLEAPKIDYEFKPIGGDTLGLDIMSFIPGLSLFVNGIIHSTLRPMLYAPNSMDINIADFIDENLNDAIGVMAVTIRQCDGLKRGPDTKPNLINPYVQLAVTNNALIDDSTKAKDLTNDPIFMETKYILINQLENNHLNFNVYDVEKAKADDYLIGTASFNLAELLQKDKFEGVVRSLTEAGKTTGKVEFDINWFPVLPPILREDGTKERETDIEVGILKLLLHEATNLDLTPLQSGLVLPYAEIYVNGELARACRKLAQTSEPSWEELFETLITKQLTCSILVTIYDQVSGGVLAKLEANLQDIVFETGRGQQWLECAPLYKLGVKPRIKISATWKSLRLDSKAWDTFYSAPIGGLRIHVREAKGLKNLELVGYVDPYCKIIVKGQERARTVTILDTLEPNWNKVVYLPVLNPHMHMLLEIMDAETENPDRSLGNCAINVFDFLKKDAEGRWMGYDGAEDEILEQPVLLNGQPHGTLFYSVLFVPCIPMYLNDEAANIEHIKTLEAKEEEKKLAQREADIEKKRKAPDDWVWVEAEDDSDRSAPKITMGLDQVIKYRGGVMCVHVLSGRFEKPDQYLQVLFDEHPVPLGVLPKTEGKVLLLEFIAEAFIRDLPNLNVVFRLAKKANVTMEKEVTLEKLFPTIDVLQKLYGRPYVVLLSPKNHVRLMTDFIPTVSKLPPLDTILDVGIVKLQILSATGLRAADSNGKLDPLCRIVVNGALIYETDKKRKTLEPEWNDECEVPLLSRLRNVVLVEVYDWDYTHEDELLGRATVDFSGLEPLTDTPFLVKLDTQGEVFLRALFKPEYIRPSLLTKGGLPDLNHMKLALKAGAGAATGAAANVGATAGGSAYGAALGASDLAAGMARDGKLIFKKFIHNRKSEERAADIAEVEEDEDKEPDKKAENEVGLTDAEKKVLEQQKGKKGKKVALNIDFGERPENSLPNIRPENLPPPQRPGVPGLAAVTSGPASTVRGHQRTPLGATLMSLYATLMHGDDAIPGRVTVVSVAGFDNVGQVDVRVELRTLTREKELIKLRGYRRGKDHMFHINELLPFRLTTDGVLAFSVREHHSFGRSQLLAEGEVKLETVINTNEHAIIKVDGGEIKTLIKYFSTFV